MIFFGEIVFDYTLCSVLLGVSILGFMIGSVGVFALLRGSSLLGDAISHAAFPGIVSFFLLTDSKNSFVLLLGGAVAGLIGTIIIRVINYQTTLSQDTALGIVLSVFFGFGLMLLSIIQKTSNARQGILNKFLFGNASTLISDDLYYLAAISIIIFLLLMLFWYRFLMVIFDPLFSATVGYRVVLIDTVLTLLFICAIVVGLQTIGVILMSSFFIAPAAAAYQWTSRLSSMVFLAGLFGAVAGIVGAFASYYGNHMPTGPSTVVAMSIIVLVSLCAKKRDRIINGILKKIIGT